MNKFKKYTYLLGLACAVLTTACEDQSEEVTTLEHDHLFAPFGLEAKVNNTIDVRLSWTINSEASFYDIEIFANDSLTFQGTPVRTYTNLTAEDMPYDVTGLEGDTKYSARFMCKGDNIKDSKWNGIYFKTEPEKLLKEVDEDDLTASSATLYFELNRTFTEVILTPEEGETVKQAISSQDLQSGKVIVNGLSGNTTYTAKLLNGEKNCGIRTLTTLIDPATAIVVSPDGKSLQDAVTEANENKNLILIQAGTYDIGEVEVNKEIQIIGERFKNKPVLVGKFNMIEGSGIVMRNIIMDGNGAAVKRMFSYEDGTTAKEFKIEASEIRGYKEGIFAINNPSKPITVDAITINNCLIYDIACDGGDFLDSRSGTIKKLTITNNTFYNCSQVKAREFIRIDGTEDKKPWNPEVTEYSIKLENNTIVGAVKTFKRLMYVRYPGAKVTMKSNLIMNFSGYLNDQKYIETENITVSNNRYYKAEKAGIINYKINDVATNVFTDPNCVKEKFVDPAFKDEANGDFTITNEDLIIDKVGDPRWLK